MSDRVRDKIVMMTAQCGTLPLELKLLFCH